VRVCGVCVCVVCVCGVCGMCVCVVFVMCVVCVWCVCVCVVCVFVVCVCVCVYTVFQYDIEADHLMHLKLVETQKTAPAAANKKTVRDLLSHLDLRPENIKFSSLNGQCEYRCK
jgi:hypothetical protein